MGSSGCCSAHIIKAILYAYQFVFLITGITICGVGIWACLRTYHYVNVIDSITYSATLGLFLLTGCLVILAFSIGCCAIPNNKTKVLFCFILLLVLIFLLEALVAVLSYIHQDNIEEELHTNLNSSFLNNYKQYEDKTISTDFIQQNLKCCGSHSFSDWKHSVWLQDETILNEVPDSCCKTMSFECGQRDHPSNIYYAGCLEKISEIMKFTLWIICAVSLGLSAIQVFGIIFGIVLFIKLESGDTDYSPNSNGSETLIPDKL